MADETRTLEWIEQVAEFFTRQEGLPPITGRILGWLMICEPPEQSAADIAGAIKASRASMTSNIRTLIAVGLIRRRTRAGERTAYYRIDDDAWEAAVRRRIEGMVEFEGITARGLTLVGADSDRASRLHAAYDVYRRVGKAFSHLEGAGGPG
ncbi:GbsR/MarR family transcriptional regulator [Mycolicibacterium sediminis]|uniref:HTH-type transcriptional regulator MmpR5 n=1 Tax=Mycolicibacterium sediminis TaxID=1286180 RepID=A0A7I7QZG9_9MYCO|nr:MarR family transcriptional regulator [Mycolicibacterium sediminis]BBY31793.1 HTH-type transcriptional regulator MmpR5 [Mycolicibacterium sediminis]